MVRIVEAAGIRWKRFVWERKWAMQHSVGESETRSHLKTDKKRNLLSRGNDRGYWMTLTATIVPQKMTLNIACSGNVWESWESGKMSLSETIKVERVNKGEHYNKYFQQSQHFSRNICRSYLKRGLLQINRTCYTWAYNFKRPTSVQTLPAWRICGVYLFVPFETLTSFNFPSGSRFGWNIHWVLSSGSLLGSSTSAQGENVAAIASMIADFS